MSKGGLLSFVDVVFPQAGSISAVFLVMVYRYLQRSRLNLLKMIKMVADGEITIYIHILAANANEVTPFRNYKAL